MIKVLIVDDSDTVCELLSSVIEMEVDMHVVGIARDGVQAFAMAHRLQPDVITMDVNMPRKNGLIATKEIMQSCARPIIILSHFKDSNNEEDVFEALEAGALAVVNKPHGPGSTAFEKEVSWLVRNIRVLSEVKVITRKMTPLRRSLGTSEPKWSEATLGGSDAPREIVAIGASTGGPAFIRQILEAIPRPYPLPIVVVQHISIGFLNGLVDWLKQTTGHDVRVGMDREVLAPGVVYFAPDDRHMRILENFSISIKNTPPDNGLRPSVAQLFESLLNSYGSRAIAILLSGMGMDGAEELLLLREKGAMTIVQDKESCIVFGMPGAALERGAARLVMNPQQISGYLSDRFRKHSDLRKGKGGSDE